MPNYITVSLTLPDGTRKYFRGKTRKEAEKKRKDAEILLAKGWSVGNKLTFEEAAKVWLDEYRARKDIHIRTFETVKGIFDRYLLPNLGKMKSEKSKDQLYVSTAIHMTHISLNEKGTKAAAVTYFGIEKATAFMGEKEYIDIEFNKPFMYMIRDTKSHEILFFGVVESPNEWKGNTCSE